MYRRGPRPDKSATNERTPLNYRSGRHFLQIPGPTQVPGRVFRAMNRAVIDHRGPEFGRMVLGLFEGLKRVFGDPAHVFIFPSSASGCWETALVNTLAPGTASSSGTTDSSPRNGETSLANWGSTSRS